MVERKRPRMISVWGERMTMVGFATPTTTPLQNTVPMYTSGPATTSYSKALLTLWRQMNAVPIVRIHGTTRTEASTFWSSFAVSVPQSKRERRKFLWAIQPTRQYPACLLIHPPTYSHKVKIMSVNPLLSTTIAPFRSCVDPSQGRGGRRGVPSRTSGGLSTSTHSCRHSVFFYAPL